MQTLSYRRSHVTDRSKAVAAYLEELRGPRHDDAYHRLIELGPESLPLVEAQFRREDSPSIRARLVEVAWQTRSPDALPLLSDALRDSHTIVWRSALDGLVTIASSEARAILLAVLQAPAPGQRKWIEEALSQIKETSRDASA